MDKTQESATTGQQFLDDGSVAFAVEQVADSVVITDGRGTILYVNAAFTAMTGYERHEAVGRSPNILKSGRQDPEWYARLWSTISDGKTWNGTLINRRKDGSHYHEGMTITPVRDASGKVVRFVAIKRDVTSRLEAEETQIRYKAIFEASRDAVLIADAATGALVDANPAAVAMLGRPIEEIRQMHQSQVHADVETGRAAFRRHSRSPGRSEHLIQRADGSIVPVEISAAPMRDAGGRDLVLGIFHDLTDRRKVENELRESEENFRQLAENISEVFWILNPLKNAFVYISPAYEQLWERPREEALRDPLAWIPAVEPEDRERVLAAFAAASEGEKLDIEFRMRTPGGAFKWLRNKAFPVRDDEGRLVRMVGVAEDITARKTAEINLAHQARHDYLTGLPNRLQVSDTLEAAIRTAARAGQALAVIYIDLDGFKFANDTLGHEAGDALLQQVTCRLRGCVREPDMLARMGGDEFMAVVKDIRNDANAMDAAERLRFALRKPFRIAGHELYLTASLGVAMYPRDGEEAVILRSNADAAMYEAKRRGKDRVFFFTPGMRDRFEERLRLDTELRRALDSNEILLNYQPILDTVTGHQVAYEALARWEHPDLGCIPPDKFIPLAEESGLIFRLGEWVMGQACRQCRSWQETGRRGVRVAVNVSPVEFSLPEFPDRVLRILEETGLPGQLLDIELTESTLMGDVSAFVRRITRLRARGIRISIDDFGTGYSSLGYLPKLPVDALKIDRSFVAGLENDAPARSLVQGIISLAHSIGKKVVVEGVETPGQLGILRSMHADEVQGYLFERPIVLPAPPQEAIKKRLPKEPLFAPAESRWQPEVAASPGLV